MIAIIPARGGSKRLPRKNIVDFCGKPMIAWTIEAALEYHLFRHVLVSTEDEEIADISRRCGAEVPFLRQESADDMTPVSAATLSALKQATNHWKEKYELVVQLMPNCPLRRTEQIRAAINHFKSKPIDFQISCSKFGWMNPWWSCTLDETNRPKMLFPEALKQRSQDLPPLYSPSGAIWIAKSERLMETGSFYGPDFRFFPMEWEYALDIDEPEDLGVGMKLFESMTR